MNIIEAIQHPQLLGGLPQFKDLASWSASIVWLKCVYGLPLADEEELRIFRHCTGRYHYRPPVGGYKENVFIVGRRSGKTFIAAVIAAFTAMMAAELPGGLERYVLLISQDQRAALRAILSYLKAIFDCVPALRGEVENVLADVIKLSNRTTIAAYPCRPASIRGLDALCVILDEFAYFTATDGNPVDQEMLRAVRPTLAMSGGKLIILSSPYAQTGELFNLHRLHFGHDDSQTLIWQATAPMMNPLLPADYLERMEADDPEAYRSEVLGEFRQGTSTFFDSQCLSECVDTGIHERVPQAGMSHSASADLSSGSGKDAAAVTVVHREGDKIVMDLCRAWHPPFNPSGVIAEIADLLKAYKITTVKGDRYAPGFVLEHFRSNGITYQFHDKNQSDLYLEMLPLVNACQVRLLDSPDLLRELRGLERRRGSSGRDKVDHRGSGSHDDRAASCAGAIVSASKPTVTDFVYVFYSEAEQARMNVDAAFRT